MSRRLLVFLVLLLVVAVAAPAAAITKKYVDDPDHTYVGLIAFYDGDGEFSHRCTGELIAPDVVLTAGHCTDNEAGGVMASARIWFQQDAGANYDPVTELDTVTGYPEYCAAGTLGTECAESDEMYNYGFNDFAGFPNIRDVGIVILDQEMPDSLGLAELPEPGALNDLRKARGTQDTTFRVSGYGVSWIQSFGIHGTYAISYRIRLMADSKLVNMVSANNDGFNIQLNGNGDERGGTCSGDSGGPVFYPADSDTVVAVTSFGIANAGCRGDGWYYRIDRHEVLAWINSYLDS